MSNSFLQRYLIATRYTLLEQFRNRFAFILLLVFVPLWSYLLGEITPDAPLEFKFFATNTFLHANGHDLILITSGLNAISLIVGFILFTSTRKNTSFDHRLILSGYPQPILILAKLTSLAVVASLVALYASLVLFAFWQPASLVWVGLGFLSIGLIYGGLGLLLGVLLKGELEGFFLVIMVSLIDTSLQNPLGNPVANQDFLKWFPSFSAMQISVAGGFTSERPWLYLGFSLLWLAGFVLLGLAVFTWKTRAHSIHISPSNTSPATPETVSSS
ncbi:MAG TPA: hypothetical protein VH186_03140 [Chloroflexia bacterium]|nr:hypothetical protein [Chloroflexia bacterium]